MLSPEELARRQHEIAEKRALKQRQRRKRLLTTAFLCILGAVLLFFSAYHSYQRGLERRRGTIAPPQQTAVSLDTQEYRRTHILFLGIDDKRDSASRTDTILLVAADPNTGSAGILSIPRDTRVYIPERDRWDRINAVHAYGGPQLTVKTVENFLGVDIDYYIETDFAGFSRIIDTLGGVEIDVDTDMFYVDTAQDLYIDIKAGRQVLDGETALQYVRYRDRLGDVALVNPHYEVYDGRVERQRKFLMAVIDEILQPSTLLKLPRLLGQVWDAVETNIPWTTALKLAFAANRFTMDKVETAILPGTSERINGAWYWLADPDRTQEVVDWIVYSKPMPLTAEVLNGAGIQGIAAKAADFLQEQRLADVKRVGNAERFNYPVSEIIVGSEKIAERAADLAELIQAEVLIDPYREQYVDVTIIVGRNFNN
ncbi:MAG: LCP family protein [Firmicutes bacterium]|nr:LCP family protein [Bacillota bacterium]